MTTDVLERKDGQKTGASTVSFLREQLISLQNLLDSTTEPQARAEVSRIREQTRNHLCALLLSDDKVFVDSFNEFMRRLSNGVPPTGLVTADEIDELLGL